MMEDLRIGLHAAVMALKSRTVPRRAFGAPQDDSGRRLVGGISREVSARKTESQESDEGVPRTPDFGRCRRELLESASPIALAEHPHVS